MARAVSVTMLKGGVGKSTIAINVADRLAARGHEVLFVDLDPNGHATRGLGLDDVYLDGDAPDLGDVVLDNGEAAPADVIEQTDWDVDVLPSSNRLETVEDLIQSSSFATVRLRRQLVQPLLGDAYNYIVTDSPAYRGALSDNALVATEHALVPITPTQEARSGLHRTVHRQIRPLQDQTALELLAIVPNRLDSRIDQRTADRQLLEALNRSFVSHVPDFAHYPNERLEAISDGADHELPGIRERAAVSKAFGAGEPLATFAPACDQIDHFDELADIVERGGILRG